MSPVQMKTFLLTGAFPGIGRALALSLARLVLNARAACLLARHAHPLLLDKGGGIAVFFGSGGARRLHAAFRS